MLVSLSMRPSSYEEYAVGVLELHSIFLNPQVHFP